MFHKILCGDAEKLMKKLANESVDLVLTDPPYKDYKSMWSNNPEKQSKKIAKGGFDFDNLLEEINRVLKNNRHFYIWCDAKTYPELYKSLDKYKSLKFKSMLVWVKNTHGLGDLKASYGPQHELCLFGCKGNPRSFFTNRRPDVLYKKDNNDCIQFYSRVDPIKGGHPTVKPLEILTDFIKRSTKEGEVILDPYAGSFSTAKASKTTNRQSISFEIDSEYCKQGKKSINGTK